MVLTMRALSMATFVYIGCAVQLPPTQHKQRARQCTRQELADGVPLMEPVREMNMSWSNLDDREFERLVREMRQPMILRGTHKPWGRDWVCKFMTTNAVAAAGADILLRRYNVTSGTEWSRTKEVTDWKSFCDLLISYKVRNEEPSLSDLMNIPTAEVDLSQVTSNTRALSYTGFKGPPYASPQRYSSPQLWMGAQGSRTPLHEDSRDNIAMQLHGTKRWHLFSPSNAHCLRYEISLCPGDRTNHSSAIELDCLRYEKEIAGFWSWGAGSCTYDDTFAPNWAKFHMLDGTHPACAEESVVDLLPGDSLYLPHNWGHMVENLGTSIMANYWLKDSWSCCGGSMPLTLNLRDAHEE